MRSTSLNQYPLETLPINRTLEWVRIAVMRLALALVISREGCPVCVAVPVVHVEDIV